MNISIVGLNGKHSTGRQRTRWEQQDKKGVLQKVGNEDGLGCYM
jgi:hypothetical protein